MSVLSPAEALFIMLKMSLNNLKAIIISGDMKSSIFVHRY